MLVLLTVIELLGLMLRVRADGWDTCIVKSEAALRN